MKGLTISQRMAKEAVNQKRTCPPRVGRSPSVHGASRLVFLLLLSVAVLSIAPTAAAQSARVGVLCSGHLGRVSLTWTASASSVAGYNIYRGNQSGGPYTLLNSSLDTGTTYSDATAQAGRVYYYVATAVKSSGVESAYSNQAEATLPSSSQLSVSPSSVNFGSIAVGRSAAQTVTLTDTGTECVVVSGETVTGTGFRTSGLSLPLTLAGGQSATFTVTFAPGAAGPATGTVSVVSNATNSPTTVSLSGTGVSHLLTISPTNLNFGGVAVGTSKEGKIRLTNSGTASVTVSQATVTGRELRLSGLSLPLTLTAGQTATFNVAFAPTTTGSVTGSLSVVSNAANSPGTVSLSGTGVSRLLTISPTNQNFGDVAVGTSKEGKIRLTNSGTTSVTVSQATVTGREFSISGLSLPLTLAAGDSTSFSVSFAPTSTGHFAGTITIVSNARTVTMALAGRGVTSH